MILILFLTDDEQWLEVCRGSSAELQHARWKLFLDSPKMKILFTERLPNTKANPKWID